MSKITLKGNPITTNGDLPAAGNKAPAATFVKQDLSEASLASYAGKTKVLNIFPSIDTGVCALSVKNFQEKLAGRDDVVVLHVSRDLPFAQKRFCGAEGVENAETLSAFRTDFARDYGVEMTDGPLKGLCARAVLVLDGNDVVKHAELVPEIAQEPNYDAALAAI
ncbi:MAG: thiol peroxidase [Planctomycetes bacterium]|nr:thiol peroxidase [Planctomycetota bacterium]